MMRKMTCIGVLLFFSLWICRCAPLQEDIKPSQGLPPTVLPSPSSSPSLEPSSSTTPFTAASESVTPDAFQWWTPAPFEFSEPPKALQWIRTNDATIFSKDDIGFEDIAFDMLRDDVLSILGQPSEFEDVWDDARGYSFRIDHYKNGDFYFYLLSEDAYHLYTAVQVSAERTGPRSLSIGNSVEDVLSTFSCQFGDMVLGESTQRYIILYGLYPPNHYPYGRPCAPCGYITEPGDYFLGWDRYPGEDVFQIRYEYYPEDDPLYQQVLAGELEYIALGEFYCVFTIQDDIIIAIEWGRDLGSA